MDAAALGVLLYCDWLPEPTFGATSSGPEAAPEPAPSDWSEPLADSQDMRGEATQTDSVRVLQQSCHFSIHLGATNSSRAKQGCTQDRRHVSSAAVTSMQQLSTSILEADTSQTGGSSSTQMQRRPALPARLKSGIQGLNETLFLSAYTENLTHHVAQRSRCQHSVTPEQG